MSTIHIPSDDLKGRIIGREGRNIRSFEQLTGTNLIIDDTPECVTISCFDPVRREIGRVTMENLIADGRIHPARIEEMYDKAVKLVNQRVHEAGEQATFDAGIHDLHPELVNTLGRLRYRTSFGQNVLNHLLEVAYLARSWPPSSGSTPSPSSEPAFARPRQGRRPRGRGQPRRHRRRSGLSLRRAPQIVHAIEAITTTGARTPSSMLIQPPTPSPPPAPVPAGDAGRLREAPEKLEEIANSHKGVERTYAIQAGREVRVMVEPEVVDEAESVVLAHDIAQQIENEMQYPGQVKVVVIRESRAVDYAK
ncbi:MAG: KH domain-containing protein [Coriobacteriaceae bacterium]